MYKGTHQLLITFMCTIFIISAHAMNSSTSINTQYPFAYRELQPNELSLTIPFVQSAYAIIDGKEKKFGLSGPFCPCKLLLIKNLESNKVLGFHADFSSSIDFITKTTKKALNVHDQKNLRVIIFSTHDYDYESIFKRLHDNREQKEEFDLFTRTIKTKFNLTQEQLQIYFFTPQKNIQQSIDVTVKYIIIENDTAHEFPLLYNTLPSTDFLLYLTCQSTKIIYDDILGINLWRIWKSGQYNSAPLIECTQSALEMIQNYQLLTDETLIEQKIKKERYIHQKRMTVEYSFASLVGLTTGIIGSQMLVLCMNR